MLSRNRRRGEHGQVLILALVFIAFFGIVTAATLQFADGTFLQHVHTEATAASDANTEGGAAFAIGDTAANSGCSKGATGTLTMQSGDSVGYATTGCNESSTQPLVDESLDQECLLCLLDPGTSLSTSADADLSVAGPVVLDGGSDDSGSVSSTAPQSGYVGYRGTWGGFGTVTPSPTRMSSTVPDPLASLPSPTSSALCTDAYDESLTPGDVYCSVTWDNFFGHHTLEPGTYYILGEMSLSDDVDVTGSGVLLYFGCPVDVYGSRHQYLGQTVGTCNAGELGGYLDVSGSANLNLSAATTGSWAGMVAMFDRDDVGGIENSCDFTEVALCLAGNDVTLGGTVYGASAPVYVNGNTSPTIAGRLVASTLALTGTVFPFSSPTLQMTGSAMTTPYCSIADAVVGGGSAASIAPYSTGTDQLTLSPAPPVGTVVAVGGGRGDAQELTVRSVSGDKVTFTSDVTVPGDSTAIWPVTGQVVFQNDCSASGGSGSIDFNYTP